MKTIILSGGKGTRLAEETYLRPKPMVEIGGKPILWHIMNIYAHYGYKEFLIACGYRGEMIKEYFHNFYIRNSDYLINLADGSVEVYNTNSDDWKIGVIDTGLDTMTGGRVRRLKDWIGKNRFMVTYGDGVGDVNISELVAFHDNHGKTATVTAVHPPSRFGALILNGDSVKEFSEKPQTTAGWINGGFFVFEPEIFQYLDDDQSILEREPLERLAAENQLMAFRHHGFWQPMDTLREKHILESLWSSGEAPWKIW
ncbi:MAG: glucose-1-phosphate cytidylyltransferase [Nitrosopumilaceae archaeon]|nr:glucose-1-phosphate cytidylyltransferase [Nitrosopumilaceae archaeon]NIX62879.1 glucose-1-phosphate cytidylyltransferase [Nitrosopumilaceae archaeon]